MSFFRVIFFTLIAIASLTVDARSESPRDYYPLNDNWLFFATTAWDSDNAEYVSLPHTWNHTAGEDAYIRTSTNYVRDVELPEAWHDKRLFLRFKGVHSSADVFVNGCHVGSHDGGFTAFTIEITDKVRLGGTNQIRVLVSNASRNDILPTSSDMDLGGGIYRSVELMVTSRAIISPLHYSSDGVYVEQHSTTTERAEGVVRVMLSTPSIDHPTVNLRIFDPEGCEVMRRSLRVSRLNEERGVELPYTIDSPMLWSPTSPALYEVEVSIGDIDNPRDAVRATTGFRTITINDHNRLCINGEEIDIRGIGLAHDRLGRGWAITSSDIASDIATIEEIGANALRSLSGPHIAELYDYCDASGMLAWIDLPFTRAPYAFADICYIPTIPFRDNGFEQLREIIYQNYNHPSVVMWGLFSLVWQRGDDPIPYIEELNTLAHDIDPSRLTVGCSNTDGAINFITDLIVLRQDIGWSRGSANDLAVWCRQLSSNRAWSAMRYGVCYGEEGSVEHQSERIERAVRGEHRLPERRQSALHARYADILCSSGIFWGVWIESAFDYAASRRAYGLNQAGLVGYDHLERKDAFYLYRALWNDEVTTLHIADRRWSYRRDTLQHIDIYCSEGQPTLLVNGDTTTLRRVAEAQYRADSLSLRGRVRLKAISPDHTAVDSVELIVGGYAGL